MDTKPTDHQIVSFRIEKTLLNDLDEYIQNDAKLSDRSSAIRYILQEQLQREHGGDP